MATRRIQRSTAAPLVLPSPARRLQLAGRTKSIRPMQKRALTLLARAYLDAACELDHSNAYELLVATILSAQCTDKRVNLVTPALFAAYPSARELARADAVHLQNLVRTTGFFRVKAKNLQAMAALVMEHHGGVVPQSMNALTALPGVARKTANVVMGVCYGLAEGVVVDTHVLRLSGRLGFSEHDEPKRVERDLMQLVPRNGWIALSHRLIAHGRARCKALRPQCVACPLQRACPAFIEGRVAP